MWDRPDWTRAGSSILFIGRRWRVGANDHFWVQAPTRDRLLAVPAIRRQCVAVRDTSFDVVYFTNMHSQLDELDRWRYVKDSLGVLRLGRISIDTIDDAFDRGWSEFTNDPTPESDPGSPPHGPRLSTGPELKNDRNRAGLESVHQQSQPPRVIRTANKPKAKV